MGKEIDKMSIDEENSYKEAAKTITDYISENNIEYVNKEKNERLYKQFQDKFSPEVLKNLSDDELLNYLFLHDGDKNNLCYALEFDKDYEPFGGIGGGNAFKFYLFKKQKNGEWTTGSSRKQITLTYDDALKKGIEIRDVLVESSEIISSYEFNNVDDYENFYNILIKVLDKIKIKPVIWIHKYFHMIFPEKFAPFYTEYIQENILNSFKIKPNKTTYGLNGQLILISRLANLKTKFFTEILLKMGFSNSESKKNSAKDSKGISDKSLPNGESHKPRIWRIYPTTLDNIEQFEATWNSFKDKNYVGLGYSLNDVNLNDFGSKEELKEYMIKLHNDPNIRSYNQVWDFVHSIKINDIIIASGAANEILGVGTIESEYIPPKEIEITNVSHPQIRKVKWIKTERKNMSFKYKNSARLAFEEIDYKIWKKIEEEYFQENEFILEKYRKENFLKDIVFQEKEYDELVNLIKRKKNIILQGAPGVGKSFIAKKLAYSLMGFKDEERVEFVQFHQSYSYEDFIQGYRPNEDGNGFELNEGVFYSFVNKAKEDQARDYYFIIDEINRGNISKIFGELLMLIEEDKRGESFAINLTYSKNNSKFFIPENLYIIGMMNTADRSLAIIDYALRRRFVFYTINPLFGEETEDIFKDYLLKIDINNDLASKIISKFRSLNETISKDSDLGEGFRIGHSYFCSKEDNDKEWYESIIKYEIEPLLKEYWFDNEEKVGKEINNLLNGINFNVEIKPNENVKTTKVETREKITEAGKFQYNFWREFKEKLDLTNKIPNLRNPRSRSWYSISIGNQLVYVTNTCNTIENKVSCGIYISNSNENADKILFSLEDKKEEIERQMGESLVWGAQKPNSKAKRINLYLDVNLKNQEEREKALNWLMEHAIKFAEVFSEIIKSI